MGQEEHAWWGRCQTSGDPRWLRLEADDAIAGVSVLASLALFAYARRGDRDPRFVLDLGLGYMVLTAFAIGLMIHWDPVPADWPVSPMISWIGPIVLMFAAIVPSTPGKTLVAGLIAVSRPCRHIHRATFAPWAVRSGYPGRFRSGGAT